MIFTILAVLRFAAAEPAQDSLHRALREPVDRQAVIAGGS